MAYTGERITDYIDPESVGHLPGLFRERVRRSPDAGAYQQYDPSNCAWVTTTWAQMATQVRCWQAAMVTEGLQAGDRVAIMLRNCREWVACDQAALALGLVVVPLYTNDRAENVVFILDESSAKLLLVENTRQCEALAEACEQLTDLQRIVVLDTRTASAKAASDSRLVSLNDWLADANVDIGQTEDVRIDPNSLASIVYTSGTTGRPKGVMLSHWNMLWNAWAGLQQISMYPDDVFLSFLPLSHTLERTVGYYVPMMGGARVAYARSIVELGEDLLSIKPTMLITVPRVFERVHNRIQHTLASDPVKRRLFDWTVNVGWKRFLYSQKRGSWSTALLLWPLLSRLVAHKVLARLGGRVHIAISGGAPLPFEVARTFIALGLNIAQGYGLTETSPVISVNRLDDNDPMSVGTPLTGVEVRLGANNELQVRSPGVMLGYWNNPAATAEMIDPDGWLRTGDQVRIERNHIYITGRIKEIIVLANGEKIAPADVEQAIVADPLIEQAMIIGEQRPYLCALVVLEPSAWRLLADTLALDATNEQSLQDERVEREVLDRIAVHLHSFPGYAVVRRAAITTTPWSTDNGMATPTMKLRRGRILKFYGSTIEELYAGH